jgi:type II secretory ATPase GspE/PulE/Tfp pilus assembly ATPase PilB-like protein
MDLEFLGPYGVRPEVLTRGKGCGRCNDTGFMGRTAISEIMVVNDPIRELIYQGASVGKLKEAAIENGMITLDRDGIQKVLSGRTTVYELKRVLG